MPDIVSAREAFNAGKTRYFTGISCKHGHIAERMISNGSCVECLRLRTSYVKTKAWREANPEKWAAQSKRYALKHPEANKKAKQRYQVAHLEEIRKRDRAAKARMRSTNPEVSREIRRRFHERKEKERVALAGRPRPDKCEICGEFNLRICFDHCHNTGKFRGWLCDRCNKVLGIVKDSPELLENLANYLRLSNGEINIEAA